MAIALVGTPQSTGIVGVGVPAGAVIEGARVRPIY